MKYPPKFQIFPMNYMRKVKLFCEFTKFILILSDIKDFLDLIL